MSIRLGGAILGFPVIILLVGVLGWGSAELAFFITASVQNYDEEQLSMQGNCIIYENGDKFCKNDFGLFGTFLILALVENEVVFHDKVAIATPKKFFFLRNAT